MLDLSVYWLLILLIYIHVYIFCLPRRLSHFWASFRPVGESNFMHKKPISVSERDASRCSARYTYALCSPSVCVCVC